MMGIHLSRHNSFQVELDRHQPPFYNKKPLTFIIIDSIRYIQVCSITMYISNRTRAFSHQERLYFPYFPQRFRLVRLKLHEKISIYERNSCTTRIIKHFIYSPPPPITLRDMIFVGSGKEGDDTYIYADKINTKPTSTRTTELVTFRLSIFYTCFNPYLIYWIITVWRPSPPCPKILIGSPSHSLRRTRPLKRTC